MPARKMKEIQKSYGDLDAAIIPMINQVGRLEAARRLSVSPTTLSKWLERNGYRSRVIYERDEQPKGAA